MILVDTGHLVAAANRTDAHHTASVAALAMAKPPRFVPGLVIAEVSYLLARDAGSTV
jgi:predicted nucleic acid-binding protein